MAYSIKGCRVDLYQLPDSAVRNGWCPEQSLSQAATDVCKLEPEAIEGSSLSTAAIEGIKEEPEDEGEEITVKNESLCSEEYEDAMPCDATATIGQAVMPVFPENKEEKMSVAEENISPVHNGAAFVQEVLSYQPVAEFKSSNLTNNDHARLAKKMPKVPSSTDSLYPNVPSKAHQITKRDLRPVLNSATNYKPARDEDEDSDISGDNSSGSGKEFVPDCSSSSSSSCESADEEVHEPAPASETAHERRLRLRRIRRHQKAREEGREIKERARGQVPTLPLPMFDKKGRPYSQSESAVASRRKRLARKLRHASTTRAQPPKKRKMTEERLADFESDDDEVPTKNVIVDGVEVFKNLSAWQQKCGKKEGPPCHKDPFLLYTGEDDLRALMPDPSSLLYLIERYVLKVQARATITSAFSGCGNKKKRKSGNSSQDSSPPGKDDDDDDSTEAGVEESGDQDASIPWRGPKAYSRTRGKKLEGVQWECLIPACEGLARPNHMRRHYQSAHGFNEAASKGMNSIHRRLDMINKRQQGHPTLSPSELRIRAEALLNNEFKCLPESLPSCLGKDMQELAMPLTLLVLLLDGIGKRNEVAKQIELSRGKNQQATTSKTTATRLCEDQQEEIGEGEQEDYVRQEQRVERPGGLKLQYLAKGETDDLRFVTVCPICLKGYNHRKVGQHIIRTHNKSKLEARTLAKTVFPFKKLVKIKSCPGRGESLRSRVPEKIMNEIRQEFVGRGVQPINNFNLGTPRLEFADPGPGVFAK
ncbi:uncharacterized protein LOC108668728 isoform X1 [Hyalella azteca]|uniref:Uncharacterized protein LOC108668728 isoform X1 n=1 Tax=Hyalella azteca TaxID=294128 RepID=A0A8B7ND62_HYAAZ|nr:uncharacterized protein LOC108668728 isoform X1 [Hyalella azteca]